MDSNGHHDMAHQNTMPPTPSSSRKRSRENETPSQRHKREKAAERQRRKRERDRQAGLNNILALSQVQTGVVPVEQQSISVPQSISEYKDDSQSPEDQAKRDRVRAAARERQRKHRALVKARKLRELGLDMGNEIIPGMEDVQYRPGTEGPWPVMPPDIQPPQHAHPHAQQSMNEPPFPQGQPLGGQTFASTLLLSFSCAPLLKAHLLRTLSMTNDELASLEPIIAQAWDHWDQQRRMHFAHHPPNPAAGKVSDGTAMPGPEHTTSLYPPPTMTEPPHPYAHDPSQAPPNDFRARFHRQLTAPSPFRTGMVPPDPQSQGTGTAPSSTAPSASGSVQQGASEGMDPSMSSSTSTSSEQRPGPLGSLTIDPQLGQARDEAAGVAGKLER